VQRGRVAGHALVPVRVGAGDVVEHVVDVDHRLAAQQPERVDERA
jgi:hypothetical protein